MVLIALISKTKENEVAWKKLGIAVLGIYQYKYLYFCIRKKCLSKLASKMWDYLRIK